MAHRTQFPVGDSITAVGRRETKRVDDETIGVPRPIANKKPKTPKAWLRPKIRAIKRQVKRGTPRTEFPIDQMFEFLSDEFTFPWEEANDRLDELDTTHGDKEPDLPYFFALTCILCSTIDNHTLVELLGDLLDEDWVPGTHNKTIPKGDLASIHFGIQ
jgi:hypothetical protein